MRMLTRPAIRIAFIATVLTASAAAGTAHAATTTTTAPSSTHIVTATAQEHTSDYWTKARMESATAMGSTAAASSSTATIPNPVYFDGVPTVGALFFTTGTESHFCTASVVNSPRGDIILTAAHCVYGTSYATNIAYVPKWHDGISPYGAWTVTSITVANGWIASQDPNLDFAFLTVAPSSGRYVPIQRVTGGLQLGINLPYNEKIHVIGYNNTDSAPLLCATTSSEFEPTQIQFYCNNYWDGTSGGPWIVNYNPRTGTGIVFGDIGGYEQGGDYPYLSYSPYYSWSILALFYQAWGVSAS